MPLPSERAANVLLAGTTVPAGCLDGWGDPRMRAVVPTVADLGPDDVDALQPARSSSRTPEVGAAAGSQ